MTIMGISFSIPACYRLGRSRCGCREEYGMSPDAYRKRRGTFQ